MTQLFGHKWHSQAGPIKHKNGKYTEHFLLWCRKLEGLSDKGYQRGFWELEHRVKEAAKNGEDIWPPSYAGFLGFCETPYGERAHRAAPVACLEDKTKREQERAVGKVKAKELLAIFEEVGPGETGQAGN